MAGAGGGGGGAGGGGRPPRLQGGRPHLPGPRRGGPHQDPLNRDRHPAEEIGN